MIDVLLKNPLALTWMESNRHFRLAVTSTVVMEVLRGAHDKRDLARLGHQLAHFEVLHILKQDSEWAVRQFRAFWLSHHIGINDCFIAAVAARTGLPIYTVNISDFEPLPGVAAQKPY